MPLGSDAASDQVSVLIVEDEILIGLGLALALNIAGYRVLGPVGSAARALALAAQEWPKIALVDIDLQGRPDGIDVARAMAERHGTTVVFVTGEPEKAHQARDCALGVITKPYDLVAIPRVIETAKR